MKFNMLLCWCIGKAASRIEEIFLLPADGKMFQYDCLAVNVIVPNRKGGINSCDVPFSDDIEQFDADYKELTARVAATCESEFLEEYMIVGTSTLPDTELDCIVNQYSGIFNNPYLAWGRYRKGWFKTTLPVSLQFHHAQMDGMQACRLLNYLQEEISRL